MERAHDGEPPAIHSESQPEGLGCSADEFARSPPGEAHVVQVGAWGGELWNLGPSRGDQRIPSAVRARLLNACGLIVRAVFSRS